MRKFSPTILTTEELYTFAERFKKLLQDSGLTDDFIVRFLPILIDDIIKLSNVIKRYAKSAYTKKVSEKDGRRDKAFVGFRDYIDAFTHSMEEEKAKAALYLKGIITRRGNTLHRLGDVAETAELRVLFQEMDTPEAQAAIEIIDALIWYNTLKDEQLGFEDLYMEKVDTESKTELPETRIIRKDISRTLHLFIDYIYLHSIHFPDAYRSIAVKTDELITDIVTIAKARQTRKENKKTEEE